MYSSRRACTASFSLIGPSFFSQNFFLLADAFHATTTDAIYMQYLFVLTFNATIKENIQH
jgi:hypothetical protein